ncbi:uncharacterized protein THITE_2058678, partial [Thermothielavioides terrestris NRRL 8126]
QPATEPLPLSATKVVVRFPDPRANLNDAVRVENEVAAMVLAHDALKPLGRSIVPAVYGWSSAAAGGTGWVLMECMPGTRLDLAGFKKLGRDAKKAVLGEIARVLRLLQQYKLPASVEGYGGLGFAEDGTIAVGPTAIYGATKRCETYHELYTECVSSPLFVIVNSSSKAAGWKDSDLRTRIDEFVERGFKPLLERSADLKPRQTLVHGDFGELPANQQHGNSPIRLCAMFLIVGELKLPQQIYIISLLTPPQIRSRRCWTGTSAVGEARVIHDSSPPSRDVIGAQAHRISE